MKGSGALSLARRRLVLLSPIAVILLTQVTAQLIWPTVGAWGWVPVLVGYWIALALLIGWAGGRKAVANWLKASTGSRVWVALAVAVALGPTLPIFLANWHFLASPWVFGLTIVFVLVNPALEEGYWRGLLLDAAVKWPRQLAVLYSSVGFALYHLWIGVGAIGARNPAASLFQVTFGVAMAVVYLKTGSLRWPLAAHCLVDAFCLAVPVFLNLYIPSA